MDHIKWQGANSLSIVERLSTRQSVHYERFHYTVASWLEIILTTTLSLSVGDDYNIPVTSVMLTSAAYTYSVAVEIMNDNIPEPRSESLQVSFSVEDQDRVQFLPRSSITITIEDNDGKEEGTYIQTS